MKRILFIFTYVLFVSAVCGQTDSIKGNQYFLKGKVFSKVHLTPDCGYIAFATVAEFEVISYSDTSYKDKRIAVIIPCPEFYKKGFFEVGKTYDLKIADQNQASFGWTIPNLDLLKKYTIKYKPWVIDATKND